MLRDFQKKTRKPVTTRFNLIMGGKGKERERKENINLGIFFEGYRKRV